MQFSLIVALMAGAAFAAPAANLFPEPYGAPTPPSYGPVQSATPKTYNKRALVEDLFVPKPYEPAPPAYPVQSAEPKPYHRRAVDAIRAAAPEILVA